jgi:HEAT repeat protein
LLTFFRQRTASRVDGRRLEELVRQLSSYSYRDREKAAQLLIAQGESVLSVLKQSLASGQGDADSARRLEQCIAQIERGTDFGLVVAAARLLALHQLSGAAEVLFDYLPGVEDEWIREELLASVGVLTVRQGSPAPVLMAALQASGPDRRAAAAYILGQRGGVNARATVRQLLADADASVRRAAAAGLAGKRLVQGLRETAAADALLLQTNLVGNAEADLVEFLRQRSLTEADIQHLKNLILQLGHGTHRIRSDASRKLATRGPAALPFLRQALDSPDPETARRARMCIDAILGGPGPALPAAVIRQLTRLAEARSETSPGRPVTAAVAALLNYAPFVDDPAVEEEVFTALTLLSVRKPGVDRVLTAALHDPLPARRAAAAYVLGHVGARSDALAVRKLLDDPYTNVRLRAAQGLAMGRDRIAVPVLIAQLTEAPLPVLWQIEEFLRRLGGDAAPPVDIAGGSADARRKAAAAWAGWWRERGSALDLAGVNLEDHRQGLTMICEYDSIIAGRPGGQVWECGRDGKARWQITGLLGPMDAQVLPNGRVLVAENAGQRVTERALTGAIQWEHHVNGNPIACQRLPNGNTFIATYNHVMEVTATHQVVYTHNRGPAFYLFSAKKLRNGHILCMTAQGVIMELDAVTGKEIQTVSVGENGWCGVETLPSGKFLVALMGPGQIRVVDASGKSSAAWGYPGVFRATRLPNGHMLVASMTTRKVAELDRSGTPVWEHACAGRPWQVRWR